MRGELRAPLVRLLADGSAVPGVISAEVWSNNHLSADRFQVRLAAGAGGFEAVDRAGVRLEVQAGVDGSWTGLVVGEADCVTLDALRGVIEVEGRDLSALLIDGRVDETFANRTSSEIVVELAGRHSLAVEATATGTLVGRYYQSEHDRTSTGTFSKATSEWDLLAYLAAREGFDLFMDGAVLRFVAPMTGEPFVVSPEDCISLELEHALGMERTIEVTVRSWDQRGAKAVMQVATGGGGGARAWRHALVRPNLPTEEAQRLAQRVVSDLVRHTRTVSLAMPGEFEITPRSLVGLSGTGTAWDRVYAVSEVVRQLDARHGFTQRVRLQGMG